MTLSSPNSLIVYGDINLDLQLKTSFHPASGQDSRVEETAYEVGGSAANCAAVAARLGIPTSFIGAIGSDLVANQLEQDLIHFGVSTRFLKKISGKSGMIVALIDPSGERTFYSYRGVNAAAPLQDIPASFFSGAAFLHLSGYSFQNEISERNALILLDTARRQGCAVSLDASFWFSKEYLPIHPELLAKFDILFANREEAQQICGLADPGAAAQELLQAGPAQVIVKAGSSGCYLSRPAGVCHVPAFTGGPVVDTTGAGDAFCAGFLAGQILKRSSEDSARLGNAAAALIIRSMGGHTSAPTLVEMVQFLKANQAQDLAARLAEHLPLH